MVERPEYGAAEALVMTIGLFGCLLSAAVLWGVWGALFGASLGTAILWKK